MRGTLLTVVAVPALCLLPGCIAWEIRDEMRLANANLACANAGIDGANRRIDTTNAAVADANTRMDGVSERLDLATERMMQTHENIIALRRVLLETNARLTAVEARLEKTEPIVGIANSRLEDLMVLREVHRTLLDINTTLGPLSRSMSSVGGVVSLLGLGGDAEPPAPTADATANAADPAAAPAPPAHAAAAQPAGAPAAPSVGAAAKARSLLPGTWVLAYPVDSAAVSQPAQALVILPSGKYLLAEHGRALVTGDWALVDRTLTLTPTPAPALPAPAAATGSAVPTAAGAPCSPGAAAPAVAATPQPVVMEVLNNTLRALSVRMDDQVRVYTRP